MGIGSVVGNFLVGAIVDIIKTIFTGIYGAEIGLVLGMQAGYAFIGGCALMCSGAALILYRYLKRRNELI